MSALRLARAYRCTRCGALSVQVTNHTGKTYSCGHFNTCPSCPPWAKYPEHGGGTVWEYAGATPAHAITNKHQEATA